MSRRIIHDADFMDYVMTPPRQSEAKYEMYEPVVSTMRIVSNNVDGGLSGLSQVPIVSSGGSQQDWITPVVVIVVSAMALMTLYAVLSKR